MLLATRYIGFVVAALVVWQVICADVASARPPAGAAALVNEVVVSAAEVRREMARIQRKRGQGGDQSGRTIPEGTWKEALNALIDRELLYQESLREGIRVEDAAVEAEIAPLRKRFPSESDFNASLDRLGLSSATLREQIRKGMAVESLAEARLGSNYILPESEARRYYDSHRDDYRRPARIRLSHILVKPGVSVSASGEVTAREKIEDMRRRLVDGADFAQLAKESDDTNSKRNGGDLGYYTPGQLEHTLDRVAFSLDVGQVSPVVEDRFGFHLLKISDRQPEFIPLFEEVRERVVSQARREHGLRELAPHLKRLRETATVEIYPVGDE